MDKELKKCGRGATDHRVEDSVGVVAIKWYDNKPVTLLSTFVGVDPTDSVRRWDKAKKEHVQVYRPSIVKEYNKFMGGVDLHDSLTALYKYPVRSKRWYPHNGCSECVAPISQALWPVSLVAQTCHYANFRHLQQAALP